MCNRVVGVVLIIPAVASIFLDVFLLPTSVMVLSVLSSVHNTLQWLSYLLMLMTKSH